MKYIIKSILNIIIITYMISSHSLAQENSNSCKIESLDFASNFDFNNLKKIEIESSGEPSEGALIEVYFDNSELKAIKASYFASTIKYEYEYFFASNDNYLVVVNEFGYSAIVGDPKLNIVDQKMSRFIVCGDKLENFPNSHKFNNDLNKAKETLSEILLKLQK